MFGFQSTEHTLTKWAWFAAMMVVLTYRFVDALIFNIKLSKTDYDGKSAIFRFVSAAILTAIIWSTYAVTQFEDISAIELATLFVILSSLAGSASTMMTGHKNAAGAYVLIILLPISIMSLASGFDYRQTLGVLGIFFAVIMFVSARKAANFTAITIQLKNENASLIDTIQAEKSDIDRVNQELSDAYQKLNEANNSLEVQVSKRTEKIAQLSNIDPLTGLYNRSAFTAQLKDLLNRSENRGHSLALLFIDLNGFKKINDTLGHKVGDAVLVEVAKRLEAFANDYHAGRWGGDEFLIALPYAQTETALSVATALQTRISQTIDVLSNQLNLGAAVGIAMYPEHSKEELELIQLADFAMFEQKKSGNNEPRMFTVDLYQNLKQIQELRDGLQQAIANKELYLCYQPIMCNETDAPWSFEALLRWEFNGQLIRPDIFIPLAEQSGLIKEIGAWVLHRACIDASQWNFSNSPSISVNVSVIQLLDDDFIQTLDRALLASGLNPEKLHVEITESIFADNKGKVKAQLNAIKNRNIKVSIDDFGTGYSSLSQLQTLNFDTIKIDKSFVQSLEQGGGAIIRATMFIAQEFASNTVAEGIETQEQADALNEMGVDYLQGFMYAKPMKKADLIEWMAAREYRHKKKAISSN